MRERATLQWFVYGSHRPTAQLFRMIEDAVLDYWPSMVIGELYEHSSGIYPVADFSVFGGFIVGTTLEVELNATTLELMHMEVLAGNTACWMQEMDLNGNLTGRQVLAFEFNKSVKPNEIGSRIPGGDWLPHQTALATNATANA